MKLVDVRAQWCVEGTFVALIEAKTVPSADEMLAYWGMRPDHPLFGDHARPNRHSRYVLLRPDGNFVIVPFTHDVREYP